MARSGMVQVLVDAHNVMYRHPPWQRLIEADAEAARAAFEQRLAGRANLHLFYDGGPGGEARSAWRHGLHLDYAGSASADDRIVRWLQLNAARRAVVVSDDRELQRRARALGAAVMPVAEFLAGLPRVPPGEAGRGAISAAEADQWYRIFYGDDG
jgi:hypothetical protein